MIDQTEGANQDGEKHGTRETGNPTQKRCIRNPKENSEEGFQEGCSAPIMQDK